MAGLPMLLADQANPFTNFLQYLFLGLQKGAVYATLALALVIVFRVSGILNFAQGEMAMFSTFITWAIWGDGRVSIWLALLLSAAISFAMGAAIELVAIRPVAARARGNPLPIVIATIGLFLALNALPPVLWGPNTKQFPTLFGDGSVKVFGASLAYQTIGTLVVLVVVVVLLYLLFQRTRVGLAMRGVASNAESTALAGVNVDRMLMLGWALAAVMGCLAGALTANVGLDDSVMLAPLIYAFAGATLGGFDSPGGAVLGGLIVGVVAEFSADYVPFIGEQLRIFPAFALILIVLLFLPQGLFGKARVVRV
jgi:branched-chain amino acid transport system permease protein